MIINEALYILMQHYYYYWLKKLCVGKSKGKSVLHFPYNIGSMIVKL